MPQREQRPYVGLMPVVPVKAAGWRIEPPVSEAVAPKQSRAATAAAEPPTSRRERAQHSSRAAARAKSPDQNARSHSTSPSRIRRD